jgi:transglutaminase-like putative cysteine protease
MDFVDAPRPCTSRAQCTKQEDEVNNSAPHLLVPMSVGSPTPEYADAFVRETPFCNFSDPQIGCLSEVFRYKGKDEREIAVEIFEFVRDAIAYEVGNWQRTASDTLRRGKGTCTNSANLMVALLRRLGIPAGYGVMIVSGREYLGPAVPARLAGQVAKQSKHVYVCVRLEDQWLRCDPSDDWALSTASHHINPQCQPVVWNGQEDALLNLDPRHIVDNCFPLADIDELMSKSMRLRLQIAVWIGNYFIEFLRQQGSSIQSHEQVEERFDDWIHEAHPVLHRLYRMLPVRPR